MSVDYAGTTGFRLPEIDFKYMPHMDVLGSIDKGIKLGNDVQNNFGANAPVNLARTTAVDNLKNHPEITSTGIDANGNATASTNPLTALKIQTEAQNKALLAQAAMNKANAYMTLVNNGLIPKDQAISYFNQMNAELGLPATANLKTAQTAEIPGKIEERALGNQVLGQYIGNQGNTGNGQPQAPTPTYQIIADPSVSAARAAARNSSAGATQAAPTVDPYAPVTKGIKAPDQLTPN